jgi:POT family proton-dependent oligopeptide transporter
MNGHGMPNDFMQNFDPISILIFTPILDLFVYPTLRKAGINIRPIARITIGFVFISLCLGYAAIVQHLIYNAGPCFNDPLNCPAATVNGETLPNNVHIAVQAPAYVFVGLAEIFISVTGLEYAYTKAPPTMKSFVQSLYLFTNAFGSAISEALVSVSKDPDFVWMYTGVSAASFAVAIIFFFLFNHYDKIEDESFELDRDQPAVPPTKEVEYEEAN